jgi:hypothetical protein
MKTILSFFLALFLCLGCNRVNEHTQAGDVVEFYLLQSYSTSENSAEIIENSAILDNTVLIRYDEIISYNPETYEFQVQDGGVIERLTYKSAFAVTVDKKIIYTGYIWSGFSSMSVNWIVIDQVFIKDNVLKVELGYPGTPPGNIIPDKRNEPRFLAVLERDHKLVR